MITLIIVGEGQTEETFIRDVLVPSLAPKNIMIQARLIPTSKHGTKGGALRRERVLRYLRNTLRERSDTYVTTFFDLYGLPGDFPGRAEAAGIADPIQRAAAIETAFTAAAVDAAGCRPDRFLAHIQPYEFEGLLFSDVTRFGDLESSWAQRVARLQQIRNAAASPEHINDGADTHPSARLQDILQPPRYNKVLHGALLAEGIGLERIRIECQHFASWLDRLDNLQPLKTNNAAAD